MHLSNDASSLLYYYLHLIIIIYFSVFASIEIQEIRKFFLFFFTFPLIYNCYSL